MKQIFIAIFLFFQIYSYAQEINFTSDELPGIQRELTSAHNYYLPLKDNEVLIAGGKVDGSDMTLYKLTKEGKIAWSNSSFDNFLGAAKFKNNIVVFSASGKSKSGYIHSIRATLLKTENGQAVLEKEIPIFSDKTLADTYILTDSDQNFRYLLIRCTEQEKSRVWNFKYEQLGGYTDNLQAISLDEKLDITTTTLNTDNIQKAQFISCICNNDGDIFIAFAEDNNLNVSRYNAHVSNASSTISAKITFENNIAVHTHGFIKMQQHSVALNCRLEEQKTDGYTSITGIFNFDKNKAFVKQVVMDRDYVSQYTGERFQTEIYPVGLEFYNNTLLLLQEGSASKLTADRKYEYFTYKPLIITFYNDNMKQLKELQGSENTNYFLDMRTSGYKILDNKLYLFYNHNLGGLRGIQINYQTLNLDNFAIDKESDFDIDPKLNSVLFGAGIIWFNRSALLPVIRKQSGFSENKFPTIFKGVNFK